MSGNMSSFSDERSCSFNPSLKKWASVVNPPVQGCQDAGRPRMVDANPVIATDPDRNTHSIGRNELENDESINDGEEMNLKDLKAVLNDTRNEVAKFQKNAWTTITALFMALGEAQIADIKTFQREEIKHTPCLDKLIAISDNVITVKRMTQRVENASTATNENNITSTPNIRPVNVIPTQIIQPGNTVVAHGNWTTVGRRNLRPDVNNASSTDESHQPQVQDNTTSTDTNTNPNSNSNIHIYSVCIYHFKRFESVFLVSTLSDLSLYRLTD